jgi:hypothetical protein
MEKENNLVIIDADSMIYIIGSELEHQLEPLGIMKLTSLFQIFLSLPDQKIAKFIGGKEEISENVSLLLSPTRDQAEKKPGGLFGNILAKE